MKGMEKLWEQKQIFCEPKRSSLITIPMTALKTVTKIDRMEGELMWRATTAPQRCVALANNRIRNQQSKQVLNAKENLNEEKKNTFFFPFFFVVREDFSVTRPKKK